MPERDLLSALGRLLSDSALRRQFQRDPLEAARKLALRPADLAAFVALEAGGLERQAQCLLNKRFHEIGKLMPETMARLGPSARTLFSAYAPGHWPAGHTRHVEDAIEFGRFLLRENEPMCRAEWNRLHFTLSPARFCAHFVRGIRAGGRMRTGLQCLYRTNGTPRECVIFLGL